MELWSLEMWLLLGLGWKLESRDRREIIRVQSLLTHMLISADHLCQALSSSPGCFALFTTLHPLLLFDNLICYRAVLLPLVYNQKQITQNPLSSDSARPGYSLMLGSAIDFIPDLLFSSKESSLHQHRRVKCT